MTKKEALTAFLMKQLDSHNEIILDKATRLVFEINKDLVENTELINNLYNFYELLKEREKDVAVIAAAKKLGSITSEKKAETSKENGQKGGKPKNLRGGRIPKNYPKTVDSKESDLTITLIKPENMGSFDDSFINETIRLREIPVYHLRSGRLVMISRAKTLRLAIEELKFFQDHSEEEYFDKYDPIEKFF